MHMKETIFLRWVLVAESEDIKRDWNFGVNKHEKKET